MGRTYDDWKTRSPDDEPTSQPWAICNRCGQPNAQRDMFLMCGPKDWICEDCSDEQEQQQWWEAV